MSEEGSDMSDTPEVTRFVNAIVQWALTPGPRKKEITLRLDLREVTRAKTTAQRRELMATPRKELISLRLNAVRSRGKGSQVPAHTEAGRKSR